MTDTFPVISLTFDSYCDTALRLNENKMGNGYAQRSPDGLNSIVDTWTAYFTTVAWADVLAADAFLKAHKGVVFFWTPPDEEDPKKWTCSKWRKQKTTGNTGNLQATFQQEFDL